MYSNSSRSVLCIIIIFRFLLSHAEYNNVCKNILDYRDMDRNPNCWHNSDVFASPRKIASNHGYPFESYLVQTKDGFILTLNRIPNNGIITNEIRPPVLLAHGLVLDGTLFMYIGKKSPAFYLSDKGYDVWLVNFRGSRYSSKHKRYTEYDKEFWNFSKHEMAIYDLPAIIEFIAGKTKQKGNISYIGHSLGATTSFIYASLMPKHAKEHLKAIVCLGPVAFMDDLRNPLKILAQYWRILKLMASPFSLYGLGKNTEFFHNIIRRSCTSYPAIVLCGIMEEIMQGTNPGEIEMENLPVIFSHGLSGVSFKTLIHYAQIIASNKGFIQFDYDPEMNMKIYNSTSPPQYPLENIDVPVFLYYGKNDLYSIESDVTKIYNTLKSPKVIKKAIFDKRDFAHGDFSVGKHVPQLYDIIIEYLKQIKSINQ